jgi:hypothetical protein
MKNYLIHLLNLVDVRIITPWILLIPVKCVYFGNSDLLVRLGLQVCRCSRDRKLLYTWSWPSAYYGAKLIFLRFDAYPQSIIGRN